MTQRFSLAHSSYAVQAGLAGIGAGLWFGAACFVDPSALKLMLAAAYLIVGSIGLVVGRSRRSGQWDAALQIVLSVITGFGLLFFTIHAAWWMALVGVALVLVRLAVPTSFERALLLAVGHVAAPLVALVIRWWNLYPELSTDHVMLGFGLLLGGQALLLLLNPKASEVTSVQTTPAAADDAAELAQLAMQIQVTADGLGRVIDAINQVVLQLAAGASEQGTAIGVTNDRLETFLKLSEEIREQARSVTLMAGQAAEFSSKGQMAIEQAITGIEAVRVHVAHIGETIIRLGELTQRIDEIIMSVSEIATQSNLLALNASIEAARAGVHGRGFAVVADEVRTLSQQSTSAAQQVRGILGEIQNAMKQTVEATQAGMSGVDSGVSMTREANSIMQRLSQSVNESFKSVKAIYEVIRQQMEDLEEIAITIERIERINQQNLASMRTVETVAANLNHLSGELQVAIGSGGVDQNAEHHREEQAR